MAEVSRILNKKFILLLLSLLLFNVINFAKEQYSAVISYESTDGGDTLSKADILKLKQETYKGLIKEINETGVCPEPSVYNADEDSTIVPKEEIINSVIYDLNSQNEYFQSYAKKYDNMKEYMENTHNISIFNQKDSFSNRNIRKTVEDFKDIDNVTLQYGNNTWINAFHNYRVTDYCMLVIIIYIIMQFGIEQGNSLLYFIHSTKNGRGRLTCIRLGILLSVIALISLLFYGSILMSSNIIYGAEADFFRPVQSIMLYEDCPMMLNIAQFLGLYYIVKCFVLIFFGIFVWAVLARMNGKKNSILLIVVFLGLEYMAYSLIGEQSAVSHFKYINIFNYLDTGGFIGKYKNLNVFSFPVNVLESSIIILLSGIFIFGGICLYKGIVIYNNESSIFSSLHRKTDRIKYRISPVADRTGMAGGEFIKIFFIAGGIYIVMLFGYIGFERIDNKELSRSVEGKMRAWQYSQMYVPYSESMEEEIAEKLSDAEDEYNSIMEKMAGAEEEEILLYQVQMTAAQNRQIALESINSHVQYLKRLKENKGITGYLSDPIGTNYLFGSPLRNDNMINAIIISVFAGIFAGGVYSYEYKSNMISFVSSTRNGRIRLKLWKMFWCMVTTGIFTAVISAIEYINTVGKVGIMGLEAPVQSVPMFEEFPVEISLKGFIIAAYILRILFSMVLAVTALAISKYAANMVIGQVCSTAVIALPVILYYLGMNVFSYISIGRSVALSDVLVEGEIWNIEIFALIPVMTVVGIVMTVIYLRQNKK